ncbi:MULTISPECIES: hypothetical protein [Rhodococcus]|uniref:hypothetical protein n=1 Tax=Rhodococcus TaxID=1827 RepID=UPI0002D8E69A|nr:hypothetical protein [Rhodococcus rhodochrous]
MSKRKVRVTVVRTTTYTGELEIDRAEYTAWLGGHMDTDENLTEFIDAGSDVDDIISDVIENGTQAPIIDEYLSEARWLQ